MSDTLRFYLVDAFADEPFRGNPAGVVLSADALSAEQMLLIAAEVGASETAFVSRLNDLHRPPQLRWCTPTVEVDFCGHATLGAIHALSEAGELPSPAPGTSADYSFDTRAGLLRLCRETLPPTNERAIWWLDMPAPILKPDHTNPIRTCELLGMNVNDLDPSLPAMRTRDEDLLYFVREWTLLMELRPRFDELAAWCTRHNIRGISVATTATLSNAVDVHSRFFAPAVGVNEDPVTGSVHGPLATYLTINGVVGRAGAHSALTCAQGRPGGRGGLVRALVQATPEGYRVRIGGVCVTTIVGAIRILAG
jgi:PhzF family phenazine biosynthesis protein